MKHRFIVTCFATLALSLAIGVPAFASHTGDRDCADFDTQGEAQRHMDRHSGDPDDLDRDKDGDACETLPGGGGVGGEATADTGPLTAASIPAGLGAIVFGTGALALARRRARRA